MYSIIKGVVIMLLKLARELLKNPVVYQNAQATGLPTIPEFFVPKGQTHPATKNATKKFGKDSAMYLKALGLGAVDAISAFGSNITIPLSELWERDANSLLALHDTFAYPDSENLRGAYDRNKLKRDMYTHLRALRDQNALANWSAKVEGHLKNDSQWGSHTNVVSPYAVRDFGREFSINLPLTAIGPSSFLLSPSSWYQAGKMAAPLVAKKGFWGTAKAFAPTAGKMFADMMFDNAVYNTTTQDIFPAYTDTTIRNQMKKALKR